MAELIRKTFAVPPLGCNCSILGDPVTKLAVVVDPVARPSGFFVRCKTSD